MKKLLVNTISSLLLLAVGISTVWFNQYYLPQPVGEPYLTMCGGLMLSGGALWFIPSIFDLFSTWEMEQLQLSPDHSGANAHGDAFQQQHQSDGDDTQTESPEAKTRGDQIDISIANAKIPFH